ncbi:MAG: phosphoribosylformylglycinamidine synthase subunit PurQ [Eggerthellaceae bacterium]|nr:phosphoribosylformylglycinamidine synthase subunit PurQ [Eggerthellaceae bacterium]
MVSRVYVEKKAGFDVEAKALEHELREILGIAGLSNLRLINRYDVEGISDELFEQCVPTVFSEPQTDDVYRELPDTPGATTFAVEALPGQFDQRADSASQCIQLISQGERPEVRNAKVYVLEGQLSADDIAAVKKYVINPVEAREASLMSVETLAQDFPEPDPVEVIDGFRALDEAGLSAFIADRGLAMDLADITFCQKYFADEEQRDPTITEIKMIDTYWSDHCRHTTFGTVLENVQIDDAVVQAAFDRYLDMRHELGRDEKPVCLMDMGTIGAKILKSRGILKNLDESEEINACTVKIKAEVDGQEQDWLFLFKNETHNHPTEIEPFGGAATCVGGAIRDPLSGRAYVYQAMRVTGAGDPLVPVADTIPGKLPQRKLVTTAAAGYSSYGNQIGLATGQVNELYHPGYVAKRMEIGAVLGATPAHHVRRETPAPGDVVVLLGGRTGRDGIGGATGSSKAHKLESLETCGAEVQKGNPPVERKIQRLFRNTEACQMIKRCNDFGAGGVSVAIGELADGLQIDLNKVPKKYDGLDGTELAISESQERMAVDLAPEDVERFLQLAYEENLEATPVAVVTEEPRVRMTWNGDTIVDVSRDFLASNGAPKYQDVHIVSAEPYTSPWNEHQDVPDTHFASTRPGSDHDSENEYQERPDAHSLAERMHAVLTDLNVASNKGLSERFDSTIGGATVLMPFGGTRQLTPSLAMVAKLPVNNETTTVTGMSWGFNPSIMQRDQFRGAYLSVVESVAKLIATGFKRETMYLTLQEYFEKLRTSPERWGKPAAAVLGALQAQVDLGVGAIGGKDSMSGSFEDLDVPPTLVSFAVGVGHVNDVVSPEFKGAGHRVLCIHPYYEQDGLLPETAGLIEAFDLVQGLIADGKVLAAATPGYGCDAEMLFKMCVGNRLGLAVDDAMDVSTWFVPAYGSFAIELADDAEVPAGTDNVCVKLIGTTTEAYELVANGETIDLADLQEAWESKLESVFPYRQKGDTVETITWNSNESQDVPDTHFSQSPSNHETHSGNEYQERPVTHSPAILTAKPKVVIPVFPGNNCEFDSARAFRRAGAETETFIVNNLSPQAVADSTEALVKAVDDAHIVFIPGGFSGGDEPDGSAKVITAFFRAPAVTEAVRRLLQQRDGLMLGICNGFQALVKLGLVPFGDIRPMDDTCPTLTFNTIGRHQSRLVRTRVASNLSPWLSTCEVGDIHTVAISHGEGRFVASEDMLAQMKAAGQIATQYVDAQGTPSMDWDVNPNGSVLAIEGITSPDGRVFGKMGHSERSGAGLYQNIPDANYQPIFEAGVKYFS